MPNENEIEQEIQNKGLNAPRLTPQDIDSAILSEHYFTAEQGVRQSYHDNDDVHVGSTINAKAAATLPCLTFCVLVLNNGFSVTGESACISPENFNAEIGRKVAKENALNKVWQLEGYLLKDKLHQAELDKQF
ncbi:Gp49 family protein [Acinetobacter baumannii]|uniref:Gp49 family protein n=1 Tax=Acinetobacter baumannii TaxID=470 RepID=UPI001ECAABE7|nr:Gp49 family protein [Acinetobacter baumannii]EKT8680279.1 hypothetical protein [Acinetobacter baumannii]EKU0562232.1 hypothetical protein [Acinetobacter baumannii]EKU2508743.1 hypothetical protein [Acinetobacter baumannii]EKW2952619.1 hypothetical protein [Acinetobacter baumannii]EKW7200666.1 hypothetical protein [Acinetobacter baumannii]